MSTGPCEPAAADRRAAGEPEISEHDTDMTPGTGGDTDETLPPVRGLVLTQNAHGRLFTLTDLRKWLRLSATIFKVEKVDILAVPEACSMLPELAACAAHEGLRFSWRIAPPIQPSDLPPPSEVMPLDVLLCAQPWDRTWLREWLACCTRKNMRARVQLQFPFDEDADPEALADLLASAEAVYLTYADPFTSPPRPVADGPGLIAHMAAVARALEKRGVEAHLLGLPFCHVDADLRHAVRNAPQFHLDHQHYQKRAYDTAVNMFACAPVWMGKAMENLLARNTSVHNAIDRSLLPWILNHPRFYVRVWMFHKLTRQLKRLRGAASPIPENLSAAEAEVARMQRQARRRMGPVCARCRFQRLCDHETETFRSAFPGLRARAEAGEPIADSLCFIRGAERYHDAVDAARRAWPERQVALAEEARRVTLREPHTREVTADSYDIVNHYTHHMPGAVRWCSFSVKELWSTPLPRIEPPFTMTLTFGGGIAEHVGFAFGRHAKIMCPMIDYTHRLTLHADADGAYVLLRDNVLVRPTEFDDERRLPVRLAGSLEPRIVMSNIDGFVITQTLLYWEGAPAAHETNRGIKYSIIVINSRYARRLQAALLAIAHQRDFDLSQVEVVIGYIPGLDTTDDIIDSMRAVYPQLRIVRVPFSADYLRSKGFMINESRKSTTGEWIVLLDADILIPPDFFARIEREADRSHFIAPDGRKMLTPETTARILLGEIAPWDCYEALAEAAPEYRFREAMRVPIGFCQCVRREILEQIPYHELDHFEGSDWIFGKSVLDIHGPETRLEGVPVLHLDHAGSQWYGAPKQL